MEVAAYLSGRWLWWTWFWGILANPCFSSYCNSHENNVGLLSMISEPDHLSFYWSFHLLYLDYLFLDYVFQRFLFIIAISIPFDIRDINIDKIATLPNQIGLYNSKLFAWFCLFVIDLLLVVDLINHHISAPLFFALFLSIEIASIIIYYAHSNRSNLFYGLIVEGLSIIMCLFVMLFTFF